MKNGDAVEQVTACCSGPAQCRCTFQTGPRGAAPEHALYPANPVRNTLSQIEEMENDAGGQADLVGGIAFRCCENGRVEGCMACGICGSGHAYPLFMTESIGIQDQVIFCIFCKYVGLTPDGHFDGTFLSLDDKTPFGAGLDGAQAFDVVTVEETADLIGGVCRVKEFLHTVENCSKAKLAPQR